MTLARLSLALSLPISLRASSRDAAPHIIFRGPLLSFHYALEAAGIAHDLPVDPITGMAVMIAGLVVERRDLGGVIVWEDERLDNLTGAPA